MRALQTDWQDGRGQRHGAAAAGVTASQRGSCHRRHATPAGTGASSVRADKPAAPATAAIDLSGVCSRLPTATEIGNGDVTSVLF